MSIEVEDKITESGKIVVKNLEGYSLTSHEIRTTTADQINVIVQLQLQK